MDNEFNLPGLEALKILLVGNGKTVYSVLMKYVGSHSNFEGNSKHHVFYIALLFNSPLFALFGVCGS